MKIIETKKNFIKCYCNNPESQCIEQAKIIADLPFVKNYVALMSDCHFGCDMPIGGVVCCKNVVVPSFIGFDISCGMVSVKTNLTEITKKQIKQIFGGTAEFKGGIRSLVPVGFSHHSKKQDNDIFNDKRWEETKIAKLQFESAKKQIGTLGGCNHFLEIQRGSDGFIYFMIHSGSRNVGYQVANYYIKEAKKLAEKYHSKSSIGFLPIGEKLTDMYIKEMRLCSDFALANRKLMAKNIKKSFLNVVDCDFTDEVNISHNYATIENHFGENLWIHRKGATSAKLGEIGIIPGSQGTSSYIVKGKGNKESYLSCSHGAGRRMSRRKAVENLNLQNEIDFLDKKDIVHSIRNKNDLDEASSSYKDIDVVMEEQKDLIDIVVKLTPLGVIKG